MERGTHSIVFVNCYWDHEGQHEEVTEFKEFSGCGGNPTMDLRACDVDTVSPPDHQSL